VFYWPADIWVSFNLGMNWYQIPTASSGLGGRGLAALTFDRAGYLHVSGGRTGVNWSWLSDNWRSTYSFNNIQQWLPQMNSSTVIPTSYCNYVPPPSSGSSGVSAPGGGGGLSSGGIAGAVVGSVVGFFILISICCCLVLGATGRWGKKKQAASGPDAAASHEFDRHEDSVSSAETHSNAGAVQMEDMTGRPAAEAQTGSDDVEV